MNENNDLIEKLNAEVASEKSDSFETITSRIGDIVLEEGLLPNRYFQAFLALLEDKRFLRLEGSWKLLRVFEENWKELSDKQRFALLPALEAHYELFHDWMACFVISGILGELYGDEKALDTLLRLRKTQKEMPRSFVPHGLEHIVSNPQEPDLARRALAELHTMEHDASEIVRKEVKESFLRLKRKQVET